MKEKARKAALFCTALLCFLIVASCGGQKAAYTPKSYGEGSVVAVWDPEDFSITEHPALGEMQEFFAARISETLSAAGGYELVERQKLLLALEELNLGSSALASESSRLQVGRVVGAQLMIFGGYQLIGKQFRVDLRLVDVESGVVVKAAEQTVTSADIEGWLRAVEESAVQLISTGK